MSTRRRVGSIVALVALLSVSNASAKDEAAATLKQISKATKTIRGIVADVEYSESAGRLSIEGTGKMYVNFVGLLRVEIEGQDPRTVLFSPPYLYVHDPREKVVDFYDLTSNPHRLGQYILLGFVPAGSALKKHYRVDLVQNATLDDRPVISLLLTPKDKEASKAIARIQLWVDPETGLPLQHQVFHAMSETRLLVRYLSVRRDDELSPDLFRADWPEGTATIRR